MSKHLREIFSSAPLPHPFAIQRFSEIRILRQNAREPTLARRQVPERPPSQETKAALIGVPTLSSLFCRGRRLPMSKEACFDQSGEHVQVSITKRPPKTACATPGAN